MQEGLVSEMARHCSNCGAEVPEGATFCPNCGQSVAQETPQQAQQTQPMPRSDAPDSASGGGATPTAQTFQPAPEPQQPAFTPPEAPAGGRSRTGLYVGCGVAAVLGLLALLVVGAVVFFFLLAPSDSGGTSDPGNSDPGTSDPGTSDPGTSDPGTSDPGTSDPNPSPAPEEGSLNELVQEQVADFTLQGTEADPDAISNGATDALSMTYTAGDGTELTHLLSAHSSPEAAEQYLQAEVDALASEGFEVVEEIPLEDEQGQQFGRAVRLTQEGFEIIVWTNANLHAGAGAPEGYAVDFFANTPY